MGIGALKAGGRLVGVIWGGDKCACVRGERTGVVVAWRQLEFLAWAQIVQRGGGLQIEADGGRIRLDADPERKVCDDFFIFPTHFLAPLFTVVR